MITVGLPVWHRGRQRHGSRGGDRACDFRPPLDPAAALKWWGYTRAPRDGDGHTRAWKPEERIVFPGNANLMGYPRQDNARTTPLSTSRGLINAAIPSDFDMAALSPEAPALAFDTAELKKWGFIWRVGTKVRKKSRTEEETEGEDALDDDNEAEEAADAAVAVTQAGIDQDLSVQDAAQEVVAAAEYGPETAPADPITVGAKAVAILSPEDAKVPADVLALFKPQAKFPSAFDKKQGMDFGLVFDKAVGAALATMLGGIEVVVPKGTALLPTRSDCVEVGPARVIGGVRPQNFDVAYRPDGVRIAYDSKTLNDASSIQKNWQNMVNDLGTEATTVHTRFPYAVVAFIVAIPRPALRATQQADLIRTLERLSTRNQVIDQNHLAEAIALVVWDPVTGLIDADIPSPSSVLRHERFMAKIFQCYVDRYKGLPPHDK
jgi:hypothetical protein